MKASSITKPSNKEDETTSKGIEFVTKMKTPRSSDLDILKNPTPRYMKSTSCSEARQEPKQLARSLNRTRIITKAPSLKPSRTSVEQVCSYSHCSLNCHKNVLNPPLKSFLLARRKGSMKPEPRPCEDDIADNETGEAVTVLYVEETGTSITALDELFAECSDVELEEGRDCVPRLGIGDGISVSSDHTTMHPSGDEILCLLDEEGVENDNVGVMFLKEFPSEESKEFSQDEITDCPVQFSDSEPSVNYSCSDEEKIEKSSSLDEKITEAFEAENEKTKNSPKSDDQTISIAKISEESSINEVATEFLGSDLRALEANSFENPSEETPEEEPPSLGDSDSCKSFKAMIRSRKQGESSEGLKPFNPREPNYLELEPGAGAEKVDLRHQEMDERRSAEEWMLDYALRNTVNQLAAARQRKVGLIVEAFETIKPPTQSHCAHERPASSGL